MLNFVTEQIAKNHCKGEGHGLESTIQLERQRKISAPFSGVIFIPQ